MGEESNRGEPPFEEKVAKAEEIRGNIWPPVVKPSAYIEGAETYSAVNLATTVLTLPGAYRDDNWFEWKVTHEFKHMSPDGSPHTFDDGKRVEAHIISEFGVDAPESLLNEAVNIATDVICNLQVVRQKPHLRETLNAAVAEAIQLIAESGDLYEEDGYRVILIELMKRFGVTDVGLPKKLKRIHSGREAQLAEAENALKQAITQIDRGGGAPHTKLAKASISIYQANPLIGRHPPEKTQGAEGGGGSSGGGSSGGGSENQPQPDADNDTGGENQTGDSDANSGEKEAQTQGQGEGEAGGKGKDKGQGGGKGNEKGKEQGGGGGGGKGEDKGNEKGEAGGKGKNKGKEQGEGEGGGNGEDKGKEEGGGVGGDSGAGDAGRGGGARGERGSPASGSGSGATGGAAKGVGAGVGDPLSCDAESRVTPNGLVGRVVKIGMDMGLSVDGIRLLLGRRDLTKQEVEEVMREIIRGEVAERLWREVIGISYGAGASSAYLYVNRHPAWDGDPETLDEKSVDEEPYDPMSWRSRVREKYMELDSPGVEESGYNRVVLIVDISGSTSGNVFEEECRGAESVIAFAAKAETPISVILFNHDAVGRDFGRSYVDAAVYIEEASTWGNTSLLPAVNEAEKHMDQKSLVAVITDGLLVDSSAGEEYKALKKLAEKWDSRVLVCVAQPKPDNPVVREIERDRDGDVEVYFIGHDGLHKVLAERMMEELRRIQGGGPTR